MPSLAAIPVTVFALHTQALVEARKRLWPYHACHTMLDFGITLANCVAVQATSGTHTFQCSVVNTCTLPFHASLLPLVLPRSQAKQHQKAHDELLQLQKETSKRLQIALDEVCGCRHDCQLH